MGKYQLFLVPLDGSTYAEQVLPHIEPLALEFEATVTLLCVTTSWPALLARTMPGDLTLHSRAYTPRPEDLAMIVETERDAALAYLDAVAARLRHRGLSVPYEQRQGEPAAVIIQRALELHADMIAMATHGHGGLARLVYGSVADDVARNAPCPVMLVRLGEQHPDRRRVADDSNELSARLMALANGR
jgi:nucleotide-binding universal stress UspA family protein